jgi:hypothetical protein
MAISVAASRTERSPMTIGVSDRPQAVILKAPD